MSLDGLTKRKERLDGLANGKEMRLMSGGYSKKSHVGKERCSEKGHRLGSD